MRLKLRKFWNEYEIYILFLRIYVWTLRINTLNSLPRREDISRASTRYILSWLSYRWAWKLKRVQVTGRTRYHQESIHTKLTNVSSQNDIASHVPSSVLCAECNLLSVSLYKCRYSKKSVISFKSRNRND